MKLNRIKAVLTDKGISQTWLAKQLDKSFSMVNAYACNRIQPNLDTLQQIAEILQVDLKELITDKKRTSIAFVVINYFYTTTSDNIKNIGIYDTGRKKLELKLTNG